MAAGAAPRPRAGQPRGIAFYDRLVDELLARGIDPWITLYHWDLPQELEDAGGWPHRDTAYRFADYATLVFDRLADRVPVWTTLNEPWCTAVYGYADGIHAPGRRDFPAAVRAVHHLLLGHGLAAGLMRGRGRDVQIGITLNLGQARPATDSPADRDATRRADGLGVRMFLDPLVHGRYPDDVVADLAGRGAVLPVREGDLELISAPLDVLGVNYYFDATLSAGGEVRTGPLTGMGWPITPEGCADLLLRIGRDYPGLPMVVTENGAAFDDVAGDDGFVHDEDRVAFLAAHVAAVRLAREKGADVRGYFAWSFLDNFEWGHGYGPRFGLVRVDYPTQRRIPKQSAIWYRETIKSYRDGSPWTY
nr:GH1 family beta-glucosidase [Planobispora longispora]